MDDIEQAIADALYGELRGQIEWHKPGECRDCDEDREMIAGAIKEALERAGYRIVGYETATA